MADNQQQLQQAYALIKGGREKEAVALLMPILKSDRDNANAWWLMANALEKPEQVRSALEQVLRLRPDNTKAQQMLVKVNTLYPRIGAEETAGDPPAPQPRQPAPAPKPAASDPFAEQDDPFAAPPPPQRTAKADPFDGSHDPFAAPPPPQRQNAAAAAAFIPVGGQARPAETEFEEAEDPFASPAPQQVASLNDFIRRSTQTMAVQTTDEDDPFEEDPFPDNPFADDPFEEAEDDLFAGIENDASDPFADLQPQRKPRQQNNTQFVLLLAALGIVAVVIIGAAVLLTQGSSPVAAETVVQASNPILTAASDLAPGTVLVQGVIDLEATLRGRLDQDDKHGWAFEGRAGQSVVIDLVALDSGLDPDLTLIAPDGSVVAQNDDIIFPENLDSRIEARLPQDGVYLIIAQDHFELAFNSDYELRLSAQ